MISSFPHSQPLGRTNAWIPEVGMGIRYYSEGTEPPIAGLNAGSLFIDTAESYGTETILGQAPQGRRDSVFLASKVSPAHPRKPDVFQSIDASLHRLSTDLLPHFITACQSSS